MDKNRVLIELSESEPTRFGKEDFRLQSVAQEVFSSVWTLESEVNNGGFSRYFRNSSAETASLMIEALPTIGAPRAADICSRAVASAFPARLPLSTEAVASTAENLRDVQRYELALPDGELMKYPDNLTDLLVFAYVAERTEEFGAVRRLELSLATGRTYKAGEFRF
jgi:hypothetical protein